jgi:electron transfer flavoprotein alpha subunit
MAATGPVLVVAEAAGGALATISAELVGAGRRLANDLGVDLHAIILGDDMAAAAQDLAALGPNRVLVADDPTLADLPADICVALLATIVAERSPSAVLLGHTPAMREVAVRLAFRVGAGITTDCTGLRVEDGQVVMTKPVYGGAALADYAVEGGLPIATIRPRAFEVATVGAATAEVVSVSLPAGVTSRTKVVDTVCEEAASGPRLKDAKLVVSGGRGVGDPSNWHVIEELADALGAAVGATRAVTDAGWVPPTFQVGLTGTTISPDLYVTVGVSGAVQHIAGCSGSRNIVAINRDPDANIYRHARFGVVGDYAKVVPAFTKRVRELRG